jgi:hypothetical protein
MTIIASQFVKGKLPVVVGDCAGDVVINDYFIDVTAAQIAAGNILEIGLLPAGHTVVDAIMIPDDLDTNGTPALVLDVGLMDGTIGDTSDTTRTCGAELFDNTTCAQVGTPTRATLATAFTIQAVEYHRSIGVKVVTAAATAAAGRIRIRVQMAPADQNIEF